MSPRTTATSAWRRLGLPLQLVAGLVVLGLVVLGVAQLGGNAPYHARLRHAAGIETGDDVRVAGLKVGRVVDVEADGDQVDVAFVLTEDPADVGLTEDTTVEVKLLSILGERFLALTPGAGEALADGGTIALENALDTYSIEEFWLESVPTVERLDLPTIQRAVDVLATDLRIEPGELREVVDGISGVAGIVHNREAQLDRLLAATQEVTDLVLDQTDEIDRVLTSGTQVMAMVYQRRETLRVLLRDASRFVTTLAGVIRDAAPHLAPALRDLRSVLEVLDEHRADLDETLRLAGPTMRLFTNAAGDGPWLGVNAPYAIVPDDLICRTTPKDCS